MNTKSFLTKIFYLELLFCLVLLGGMIAIYFYQYSWWLLIFVGIVFVLNLVTFGLIWWVMDKMEAYWSVQEKTGGNQTLSLIAFALTFFGVPLFPIMMIVNVLGSKKILIKKDNKK